MKGHRGSATVEFILSFLILLAFSAIVAGAMLKRFSPEDRVNREVVTAMAFRCYEFYHTKISEVLCIEGVCGSTALSLGGECEKSSLLG